MKALIWLCAIILVCCLIKVISAQDFGVAEMPSYEPPWRTNEVLLIIRWAPNASSTAYAQAEVIIYDTNGRPRLLRLPNTGPILLSAAQRDKKLDWWINYCENKLQTWISTNGGWAPPPPSGG